MPDYAGIIGVEEVAGQQMPMDSGPNSAVAVTLSSNTSFTPTLRGIWVGTTGNIVVDMLGSGTNITFQNVPVGYFSGHFTKVYSTGNGTTASNLVAVW